MKNPSILNDVIGPVMRGPSSSHSAAAARIGRIARAVMGEKIDHVLVEFDKNGSLPTTHLSQGSDMGLSAGLLGFNTSDKRLIQYENELVSADINVRYVYGFYGDPHPNTYRLTLENKEEKHTLIAVSTGGGMIKIIELDGNPVSIEGDIHETLIFFDGDEKSIIEIINEANKDIDSKCHNQGTPFVEIKTPLPLPDNLVGKLSSLSDVTKIRSIHPVLPILTPKSLKVPFESYSQLIEFNKERKWSLGNLAIEYERQRGDVSTDAVLNKMSDIIKIIRTSIKKALKGTRHPSRILGPQSLNFHKKLESGNLANLGVLNTIILYITALMEAKSAMEIIVAAPTAGSCGGLPGAVIGASDALDIDEDSVIRSMMAGGLVGVLIIQKGTFAAEVAGCQAECGSSSGMAAAALVDLLGGSAEQALAAASMALQNIFGMVCDPVANRVEVPCLGKNIMAASNAVSCANMALSGFDPVIPFDEVVTVMDKIGKSIPSELRCTALGGLSITKTSKEIEHALEQGATEGDWKNINNKKSEG
jgi:L-serine dehydratase